MPILEKRVYLASRSPRRRELLKQIGVSFELLLLRAFPEARADINEQPLAGEVPADSALRIARTKAEIGWLRACQRGLPRFPVLGADTVVAIEDQFIGKPQSQADAAELLRRLSGRAHRVHTAVAIAFEEHVESSVSSTEVTFRELTDAEIRAYVASGEPMDKAGAYGIQGRAACFVTNLNGSYSGVMGLPLYETTQLLRRFDIIVL